MKKTMAIFLILFCGNTYTTESVKSRYFSTTYHDLTENSTVFKIPFDFVFPKGYVTVKLIRDIGRYLIMHESDLQIINNNGGILDSDKMNYPYFFIEPSTSIWFSDGKFSVEGKTKNAFEERIDQQNLPILKIETFDENKTQLNYLLIHPNYVTWVAELIYFGSTSNPKLSIELWEKFVYGIKGSTSDILKAEIPKTQFQPIFPDSEKFKKDKYYNVDPVIPMKFPTLLPKSGETTESELYNMHPENAIQERFSLLKPIKWKKGNQNIFFDCYINYSIETNFEVTKTQEYTSSRRLESFNYQVFLLNGKVSGFNLTHLEYDENGDEKIGSKNKSDKLIEGDFKDMRINYLKSRSSLFRRVIAKEWFYEDYLSLSEKEKRKINSLTLKNLNSFPENLEKFPNLKKLDLSGNHLTKIDCQSFDKLTNLEEINLNDNSIEIVPDCLSNAKNISQLRLNRNPLKEFPKSIYKLNKLRNLDLSNTGINKLPTEIPEWDSLEELELDSNNIFEIPLSWKNIKKMRYFNLSNNNLVNVPKNLENLKSLKRLDLNGNFIENFPEILLKMPLLDRIEIMDNKIKTLPKILCSKDEEKGSVYIDLSGNPLDSKNLNEIVNCSSTYSITPRTIY